MKLIHGDCLEAMRAMPDGSVDCILADPPYHRVKGDSWDRQWPTDADYLAWMGRVADEWLRLLKPNGSLYCFASRRMAARVEVLIGGRFNVLNNITWQKDQGWAKRQCKEEQRAFFPSSESIVFAEHYGADSVAMGVAGYQAKCDELRGFVFESIYRYLAGQFEASCLSRREVDEHFGTSNVSQYWLQPRGFILPTAEKYAGLRVLRSSYFRREYEDLRREYEDLRRPFSVSSDVPTTDVWGFPTVQNYKGKHPCEKPLAMLRHVLKASTRPGGVILDPFMGSGSTGVACVLEGRDFIGVEQSADYFAAARKRIAEAERCRDGVAGELFAGLREGEPCAS